MCNLLCEYDKLFHVPGIVSVFLAQNPVRKNLNTSNVLEDIILFIESYAVTGNSLHWKEKTPLHFYSS